MNRDVELERLRHENLLLRQAGAVKEEQMKLLKQENHSLQQALKKTFQAVKQVREQVKTLQEQQAKDSHNSHLPPSSDRFGKRKQKSLRKPSGKKPGGQAGHPADSRWSSGPPVFLTHCWSISMHPLSPPLCFWLVGRGGSRAQERGDAQFVRAALTSHAPVQRARP